MDMIHVSRRQFFGLAGMTVALLAGSPRAILAQASAGDPPPLQQAMQNFVQQVQQIPPEDPNQALQAVRASVLDLQERLNLDFPCP
jgi:hypothetical protein